MASPSPSLPSLFLFCLSTTVIISSCADSKRHFPPPPPALRFDQNGQFKILQVADMHYADGRTTPCLDVLPEQFATCSDLNTTAFLYRIIRAEKPNLVVFTGDNIFASDSMDAAKSLNAAFNPVIRSGIPWAAVLGNHDQESALSREGVMRHVVQMEGTVSRFNPTAGDGFGGVEEEMDGYGNYNVEVLGADGSGLGNKSVLNLYFLDSGDYSTIPSVWGYGWIKASQEHWFVRTSFQLQEEYRKEAEGEIGPAPGLAYFHIPLPEYARLNDSDYTGVKLEPGMVSDCLEPEVGISSACVNSGFFARLVERGDVKAVFTGHDHLNDFCGELNGIQLCYAGGFGYHAYGKAGWDRRARVVVASLEKSKTGKWGRLQSIRTWKRLDDEHLSTIDVQTLWTRPAGPR